MKKLLTLLLLLCLVVSITAPVSADTINKEINASQFVDAVIGFVHLGLLPSSFKDTYSDVYRTTRLILPYSFDVALKSSCGRDTSAPYTLQGNDTKFTAKGKGWVLTVTDRYNTRFKFDHHSGR